MIKSIVRQAENDSSNQFTTINQIAEINQKRVLDAFKQNHVSDTHFNSTSGYGYDDLGREVLEQVYADVFGGEAALVRPQLVSGTHAISTSLFGILRPGDELIYITGKPYDTLEQVIGRPNDGTGSLKDFKIEYNEVKLQDDGTPDYAQIKKVISNKTKLIGIQRSKGYEDRPSFTIKEIEEMVSYIKAINEDLIVFVDNCYGEFVEEIEPLHVGADIMAGSLIKNPGGGIVRAGGYIAGREDLINQCANRLTAPGLGKEMGATFSVLQEMYQGFFLAPHVVSEALKGAVFTSRFLELLGYETKPYYQEKRTDLIQSITFHDPDHMIAFCEAVQQNSPINSHFTPYPSNMPGYDEQVIMAGGTFIQGSSIELSVDGPIKEPYIAFLQGGLTYSHVKIAIIETVKTMQEKNFLTLNEGHYIGE